jgi:hypothetical protein
VDGIANLNALGLQRVDQPGLRLELMSTYSERPGRQDVLCPIVGKK